MVLFARYLILPVSLARVDNWRSHSNSLSAGSRQGPQKRLHPFLEDLILSPLRKQLHPTHGSGWPSKAESALRNPDMCNGGRAPEVAVSMAQANRRENPSSGPYATAADFEQIFMQDMSGLYLLSFLLAGSRDGAEKCFVSGITESVRGYRVFVEWARSWARRTIILSAIRLFEPRRSSGSGKPDPATARTIDKLPLGSQMEVSAILELPPFERFVFVMSALERYSDHECSILLGCAPREVTAARTRALRQLGRLMMLREDESDAEYENAGAHQSLAPSIELTIARYFIASTGNGILSHDAPLWP